jgi:hypothetical protein
MESPQATATCMERGAGAAPDAENATASHAPTLMSDSPGASLTRELDTRRESPATGAGGGDATRGRWSALLIGDEAVAAMSTPGIGEVTRERSAGGGGEDGRETDMARWAPLLLV